MEEIIIADTKVIDKIDEFYDDKISLLELFEYMTANMGRAILEKVEEEEKESKGRA